MKYHKTEYTFETAQSPLYPPTPTPQQRRITALTTNSARTDSLHCSYKSRRWEHPPRKYRVTPFKFFVSRQDLGHVLEGKEGPSFLVSQCSPTFYSVRVSYTCSPNSHCAPECAGVHITDGGPRDAEDTSPAIEELASLSKAFSQAPPTAACLP